MAAAGTKYNYFDVDTWLKAHPWIETEEELAIKHNYDGYYIDSSLEEDLRRFHRQQHKAKTVFNSVKENERMSNDDKKLFIAIHIYNDTPIAIDLINKGINVNVRWAHTNYIDDAIDYDNYKLFKILVDKGANTNGILRKLILNKSPFNSTHEKMFNYLVYKKSVRLSAEDIDEIQHRAAYATPTQSMTYKKLMKEYFNHIHDIKSFNKIDWERHTKGKDVVVERLLKEMTIGGKNKRKHKTRSKGKNKRKHKTRSKGKTKKRRNKKTRKQETRKQR